MVSSPTIAQIASYYEKIRIKVTIMKIGSTLSSLVKTQIKILRLWQDNRT